MTNLNDENKLTSELFTKPDESGDGNKQDTKIQLNNQVTDNFHITSSDSADKVHETDVSLSNNLSEIDEFIKKQLKENLRDRLFMLNIEKSINDFLSDEKQEFYKFMPMNRYYRMFVHRIGEYFGLGHNLDQTKQCIIVNKIQKTQTPKESFQSIIEKASAAMTRNSSSNSLQSTNASSPGLTDSTNGDIPTKTKHIILKREVNTQDLQFAKNKAKAASEKNRPKTFEEKSADYIRIKNRIFSTEPVDKPKSNGIKPSPEQNETANTTNHNIKSAQKFTILNRQTNGVIPNMQHSNKSTNHTQFKNSNQKDIHNKSQNTLLTNSSRTPEKDKSTNFNGNFKEHASGENPPTPNHNNANKMKNNSGSNYSLNKKQNQLTTNSNSTIYSTGMPPFQQSLKLPQANSQKSYTIAHLSSHIQQPHYLALNQLITSNSMHEVSQPHRNIGMPPKMGPIYPTHMPNNVPFFIMNNINQTNVNFLNQASDQNPAHLTGFINPSQYFPPSNINEQMITTEQAYSIKEHQLSSPYPEQNSYQLNNNNPQKQFIPNPYMIPYHASQQLAIQQKLQYATPPVNSMKLQQTNIMGPLPFHNQSFNPNNSPMTNGHGIANQNFVPNSFEANNYLIEKQNYSNQAYTDESRKFHRKVNSLHIQRNRKSFSTSADIHSNNPQSMSIHQHHFINNYNQHPQDSYKNQQMSLPGGGGVYVGVNKNLQPQQNQKFNANNQINNTNNSRINKPANFYKNKQNSTNDLNSKSKQHPQNKKPDQNSNKKFTPKAQNSITKVANQLEVKIPTEPEPQTYSTEAEGPSPNLMVQVYNIKQDLTKKMLHDLLDPYVISIDFRKKSEPTNEQLLSEMAINEENFDVFIKFQNSTKLREALTSFNLKEFELNPPVEKSADKPELLIDYGKVAGVSQTNQIEDQSPFLFKPLSIF